MSKIADKILSRIKTKPAKKQMPTSDLMMIAEELVSALTDDNRDGVADALRAAFSCMSDSKIKKYAEGGIAEEEEEDYDKYEEERADFPGQPIPEHRPDDEDYDSPYHAEWDRAFEWDYDLKDSSGTGKPTSKTSDEEEVDWSMMYPEQRPDFDHERLQNDPTYMPDLPEQNVEVDRLNTDAIAQFAMDTGAYIGKRIDPDLMATMMGEPQFYVKVRSNPQAYKMFRDAFDAMAAEREYDTQGLRDMMQDPEFWKKADAYGGSFLSKEEYAKQYARLQREIYEKMTPEQRAAYDAQRAASEGRKPGLVELRDPRSNLTVLTDKPAKALRKSPALKVVPKKPAAKPALPRTIQTGPLR